MADNEVKVRFGADIGPLDAGLKQVEAGLKRVQTAAEATKEDIRPLTAAVETEAQALARLRAVIDTSAAATTSLAAKTGALVPPWNAAASAGSRCLTSVAELNAELNATGNAVKTVEVGAASAATAHEGLSLATAGAKRELIVLGHEMVQGNYSRFGGSLMVLAERMGGLSGPAMAAGGAIAAVGYAVYELIAHVHAANAAIVEIRDTMASLGRGADASRDAVKGMIVGIKTAYHSNTAEAGGVVQAMEGIPRAAKETRAALEDLAVPWARMQGATGAKEQAKVVEGLAKAVAGG